MRKLIRSAFWMVVGTFVFVMSLEGVARILRKPHPYTAIYRYDDLLGYRFVRNREVEIAIGQGRYHLRFDDEGILDRAGEAPESLIILGDGVVAGLELVPSRRLAAQIVGRGSVRGAVNLSVPGYGLLQQVLLLERWLSKHPAPKFVVVVVNLSNEIVDNVPEWEGGRVPAIERTTDGGSIIIPPQPYGIFRHFAGSIIKRSRLYGWIITRTPARGEDYVAPEQEWLYLENPPKELERGLESLSMASCRLFSLLKKESISLLMVEWIDWGMLYKKGGPDEIRVRAERAAERVSSAIGAPLIRLNTLSRGEWQYWDMLWLVPGTRHANDAAITVIADNINSRIHLKQHAHGGGDGSFLGSR